MIMTKEKNRRAAVLRALERSGLSMAEYCRREERPYSTVAAGRGAQRRESGRFIEVGKCQCSGGCGHGGGALRGTGAAGRSGAAARLHPRQRGGRCAVIFPRGLRVCLAAEPADLRRSIEGLAPLVKKCVQWG
jgi:hypothetical protein